MLTRWRDEESFDAWVAHRRSPTATGAPGAAAAGDGGGEGAGRPAGGGAQRAVVLRHRRPPRSAVTGPPTGGTAGPAPPAVARVRGLRAGDALAIVGPAGRLTPLGRGRAGGGHRARHGAPGDGGPRGPEHHRGRGGHAHLSPHRVPGHRAGVRRSGRAERGPGVHPRGPVPVRGSTGVHPPRTAGPVARTGGGPGGDVAAGPGGQPGRAGRPRHRDRESLGPGQLPRLGRGRRGRPEAGGRMAAGGRVLPVTPARVVPVGRPT